MRDATRVMLAESVGFDATQAANAEIALFNWTVLAASERRVAKFWSNMRFVSLYAAKARSVLSNLDQRGYVGNADLIGRVRSGEVKPEELASLSPEHMYPARWRADMELKHLRDNYIMTARPAAMTEQYKCPRCKERKCSYYEQQTRSCDEPASIFLTCTHCSHGWRIG